MPVMKSIPWLLVALRVVVAPMFWSLARREKPSLAAGVLGMALVSDILDGVLARRMGVATPRLRLADSVADGWLGTWVIAGIWSARSEMLRPRLRWYGANLLLESTAHLVAWARWRRPAAFHANLSRLSGASLIAAVLALLLAPVSRLSTSWLSIALFVDSAAHLERLWLAFRLPEWRPDG